MAGFGFSEAQEMFRTQVRDFAQAELAPRAKELAKQERVPRDIVKRLGETGILGASLPEEYGGQGGDWISFGIAVEELSKACFFAGLFASVPVMNYVYLQHASEEIKDEWLRPIIKGDKISGWGITEPGGGSDAAAMRTVATREGDVYIINGEKTSISFSTSADALILLAKTDPNAGAKGITCFLLPLNLPGIHISHIRNSGWKPAAAASVIFDGVRLPAKYQVGEEGRAFYMTMGSMEFTRAACGFMALGLAQTSMEEAKSYALQRHAFGQPIAKFEGVSFKIAEHATLIEAARLLCYRTLYLADQGLPSSKEAAMCKWFAVDVAFNAIHDCLLIHGHLGYSEEYPIEQRLRDVLGLQIGDGTAQIMKIIIARELMGRVAVPY